MHRNRSGKDTKGKYCVMLYHPNTLSLLMLITSSYNNYWKSTLLFRLLKEKLSLLSPTSSPQKKRLSPSPKLRHRATPPMTVKTSMPGKNKRVSTNSPLLRTASPLVSTAGKAVVQEEVQKTNDVV